jgi:hypothetical protein
MSSSSAPGASDCEAPAQCAVKSSPLRMALHLGFALLGAVALVVMVRHVGADVLLAIVSRSSGWIPLLIALEVLRIGADVAVAHALYAKLPRRPPMAALIRAHLIAYPVTILAPAGRAAAEALKASCLASHAGGPQAAAVGTMSQALALIGGGLIAVPCFLAAWLLTGSSILTIAIGVQVVVATALGMLIQAATRRRAISGFLRRFARAGQAAESYQDTVHLHPVLPVRALPATAVNRLLQVAQYAVLIHAVGGATGLAASFVAEGINLVGTSLGDFVPGQIGATDGAFALAAHALQLSQADGIGMSVLVHFVQMCVVVAGCAVPLLWRLRNDAGERAPAAVSM